MIDPETGYPDDDPADTPDPTENLCDQCGKPSENLFNRGLHRYICANCDWDNQMDAAEVQHGDP